MGKEKCKWLADAFEGDVEERRRRAALYSVGGVCWRRVRREMAWTCAPASDPSRDRSGRPGARSVFFTLRSVFYCELCEKRNEMGVGRGVGLCFSRDRVLGPKTRFTWHYINNYLKVNNGYVMITKINQLQSIDSQINVCVLFSHLIIFTL